MATNPSLPPGGFLWVYLSFPHPVGDKSPITDEATGMAAARLGNLKPVRAALKKDANPEVAISTGVIPHMVQLLYSLATEASVLQP